jgi:hypothetical protein
MKLQIFTGLVVLSIYSYAFCAGESHVPPKNPGQDTTGGAGYGGSGAAQQPQDTTVGPGYGGSREAGQPKTAPSFYVGVNGGLAFPVSNLHVRYSIGWNAGAYALYWVLPDISVGPSFYFTKFPARSTGFTFATPVGVPVGFGADGYSWVTDLEAIGRLALPMHTSLVSTFAQVGAGWFHYKQNVKPNSGAAALLGLIPIQTNFNGFASSYGLGLSFLVHKAVSIDLFPVFHFGVANHHAPVNYFTADLGIATTF